MAGFHVLAGMPRSGSTLLANVLDQNPDVHVSSTSCLPSLLASCSMVLSKSPELKSELIRDREGTMDRMREALTGLTRGWYHEHQGKVIIDKSRLWNQHLRLFQWLFPESRMICVVRDLRAVVGSIERHHATTGVLDDSESPVGKTLFARVGGLMDASGVVGQPLNGIEDLIRRRPEEVYFLKYEDLVEHPKTEMMRLYEDLGWDPFEHDLEAVENTTGKDVDGLYLHKYPHEGEGKVQKFEPDWDRWVSPDIAAQLINNYPGYNTTFNYK